MSCTRRHFVHAVGVAAGAQLLLKGQIQQTGPIDVHHHLFAPEYLKVVKPRNQPGVIWPDWTPEMSIQEMGKNGVSTAILSVSPPGFWDGNIQQGRSMARIINEFGARLVRDYPGRFGLFATLPLPDADGSLREIGYAFDTLKAHGIGIFTSYGEAWLGDAKYAPVWEELNRRHAVIYTHPNFPACCANLIPDVGIGTVEFASDTSRTIASLLFSGTAARYPNIRWIFSHGGGTMPYLYFRFTKNEDSLGKDKAKRLPKGMLYEMRKFYYETAQAVHPGALKALTEIIPPEQMLFGSDYPYQPIRPEVTGLAAHGFSAADLRAINRDNILKLIPQLRT